MTATMQCERCEEPIATGAGEYTPTGELRCNKCIAIYRAAEVDDRAAASKQKMRIITGASVAWLVAVPSALVAIGAGQYVTQAMFYLGMTAVGLSGFVLREAKLQARRGVVDPFVNRVGYGLFLGGAVLVVLSPLLEGKL